MDCGQFLYKIEISDIQTIQETYDIYMELSAVNVVTITYDELYKGYTNWCKIEFGRLPDKRIFDKRLEQEFNKYLTENGTYRLQK